MVENVYVSKLERVVFELINFVIVSLDIRSPTV